MFTTVHILLLSNSLASNEEREIRHATSVFHYVMTYTECNRDSKRIQPSYSILAALVYSGNTRITV